MIACSSHRVRLTARAPGFLVVALLAVALAAPAAPADIHIDPDAPAGVQYSAPLDRAREEGSGRGGNAGAPGSSEHAPLFGEGITPEKDSSEKAADGGGSVGGPGVASSAGASVAAADDSSAALTVVGFTLAVIALGGALGIAIRRAVRTTAS